mmetsp:Transcript_23386/g.20329  ORF Transcript_23386/g.20329 Transcript_23386/m.20329 type:complete len:197 (+) Transcript_23386:70-660(+)|eukprot:CAMPEP_0114590860 /NCGR_PEP_ID=MMETSP0125-20121206/13028_1 /TAXON_ID=485358 ORGANISM="Aristerostoma sp., Strain ATCC 50986" /NCGR_SAMPLE_ID=MMETSP0125 /ASSEMBLY_ACC=CAM_ASM_000245 /LENGTH=196 /DNA_ID=CAMNT_0001788609 /DNA_START=69 /DNA_END=659 /DNA_ORIENTATION=-
MSVKLKKGGQVVTEFPNTMVTRSRLLTKLVEEFKSEEVDLEPAKGKDFSPQTVNKCKEFLEKFDKGLPKLPKKPLLIFVTFNDWLDHNFEEKTREWLEDYLKPKSFYDLIELFNAAFYLQIDDLKEVVAARIAHSIILERKAPEDFLRDFGLVNKYQEFFTPEEEKKFIDKEFINKNDFEGVAADDDEALLNDENK